MRLLLDTHIFLRVVMGSSALKPPARRIIEAADEVYVSAVSIWEIAIKARLGKIKADTDLLVAGLPRAGFRDLSVSDCGRAWRPGASVDCTAPATKPPPATPGNSR